MNKKVIIVISFFFLLVPSIVYSGPPFKVASFDLTKVVNESNMGKEASKIVRSMPADQIRAKEKELIKKLIEIVKIEIEKIGQEENYDLILEKEQYIFSGNKIIDISDKVIERLNSDPFFSTLK